jgi:alanine transaminase
MESSASKVLTLENLSTAIKNVQYAVRGKIVLRAGEIEEELKNGVKKDFDCVIRANIGDCHATGQKPITFLRQVMALSTLPELLNEDKYPSDVKDRVKRFLNDCKGGSVGSYTDSTGLAVVKKDIARYIEERDGGIASNPDNIFLTTGASDGIKMIIELLLTDKGSKPAGFMIPIPQYPLYSATISEYGAEQVSFFFRLNFSEK